MKTKKLVPFYGMVILMLTPMSLPAQQKMNRYLVKNAIITYKHSGMTEGEETVYIDDYGKKEARFTNLTVSAMGFSSKTKELQLTLDDVMYSINLLNNTGTKTTHPSAAIDEKEMQEWAELGEDLMEEMGFEKTGQENILGKTCDIWEGMGTKSWVWKNLALKTEVNMMGKTTIEAIDLKTDTNVPTSKFKIPDGISFDEIEATDEELSEQNMEDLQQSLKQLKGILGTSKKK